MNFQPTPLEGACLIDIEERADERGFFARAYCQREFRDHGLNDQVAQINIAFNRQRGTLRGMHFQFPPHAESKLVRVLQGSILDIIVDLRPESETFLSHFAVELSAANRRALYVPERFAHGYQALQDGTEVLYQVGAFYHPQSEGGLSPFDRELGLRWPLPISQMSAKDRLWRPLAEQRAALLQRMETSEVLR